MVILGSILMLHSQASLVNLLKIKTSVVAFVHTFVPFSMLVGFEVQTKRRKETFGSETTISIETIEIMYQQSQI